MDDARRAVSHSATQLMIACSEERAAVNRLIRAAESGRSLTNYESVALMEGLSRVYQRLEGHTFVLCELMHTCPGPALPWWRRFRWPWV